MDSSSPSIVNRDRPLPPVRAEYVVETLNSAPITDVERPLSVWKKITNNPAVRRIFVLVVLGGIWEGYAAYLGNPLTFPKLSAVLDALFTDLASGVLIERIEMTMRVLLVGYGVGILLAGLITVVASTTRFGSDVLSTLTAMFNPLPAIALLPLALIWFGLGTVSLVFVIVHSVLWTVALNTHAGFQSVSSTLRMAGRNFGLKRTRLVFGVLIPAALPSIISGLKIGWAFAWRTLIAAELVFGASSGKGGIGWYIFENRNNLETANTFAGLLCVILIGLAVEMLVFRTLEVRTVRRWGMQQ
ncbi:ABC transporter permease (plasmid) [Cupriavidus basilensis]